MKTCRQVLAALLCWVMLPPWDLGGQEPAKVQVELSPRPITLHGEVSVTEALGQLAKQTGNLVVDRRRAPAAEKIHLDLDKVTFWPALESIARASTCGFSLYEGDAIALVNRLWPAGAVSHHGIFRTAVRRVALSRDEDTKNSTCHLDLEVAWEPRFQPFYLGVGSMGALYAPDKNEKKLTTQVEARGQMPVAGKIATEVKVVLPAPDRSCPALATLDGSFRVIGPSKMLRFTFADLKEVKKGEQPLTATQDGVKVTVTALKASLDFWSIDVLIDNPKGGPVFESFQHWLHNNKIALEHKENKAQWLSNATEEEELTPVSASRAHLRYYFRDKSGGALRKGRPSDWRLIYDTPGRIVEVQVPFTLKNIPLP